jgi:mono/diheme cytochrome c family protein
MDQSRELAILRRSACGTALAVVLAATSFFAGPVQIALAQDAKLAPITFTDEQARRGQAQFGSSGCGSCHGGNLQGLDGGPPLVGDQIKTDQFGGSVADLYNFILTNMPADNPGSLKPAQVAPLVAFIASKNGFAASDTPLPDDPAEMAKLGFTK